MANPSNDKDALAALRALANKWALMARDHARDSKTSNTNADAATASYHRGIAETYYKAAMELADVVKQAEAARESAPASATAHARS